MNNSILQAVTLVRVLIGSSPRCNDFLFISIRFMRFIFTLISAPAPCGIVTVEHVSTLRIAFFRGLTRANTNSSKDFFTLTIYLPRTSMIRRFINIIIRALLALLNAPCPSTIPCGPFRGGKDFVYSAASAIRRGRRRSIGLTPPNVILSSLRFITNNNTSFITKRTFFLFFVSSSPTLQLDRFITDLSLRKRIDFVIKVRVRLLVNKGTMRTASAIIIFYRCGFLAFVAGIKASFVPLSGGIQR